MVQRWIFPYLGGRWSGFVKFQGPQGPEQRDVTLEVKHTLFGLRLILDSAESTSRTLVVQAERDKDFDRYRLYYVYLNERKEGAAGVHNRYRGLAIMRVEWSATLDYSVTISQRLTAEAHWIFLSLRQTPYGNYGGRG